MQNQVILNGISLEQLKDEFKAIVRTEVQQILIELPPTTTESSPEFITRKETAKILGVSLPTLHEWTKNGTIPALRIGSRVRYKISDVYASLKSIDTIKYKRF